MNTRVPIVGLGDCYSDAAVKYDLNTANGREQALKDAAKCEAGKYVTPQAVDCFEKVSGYDLDTKSGREKAFEEGARCAADYYCAQYGIPPETGICGTVAAEVVEFVTGVWNDVFGNEEEWQLYRARQSAHAAWRSAATQASIIDGLMSCALHKTTGALAELWDEALPEYRGAWGPWVTTGVEVYDYAKSWTTPGQTIVLCSNVRTPRTMTSGNIYPPIRSWLKIAGADLKFVNYPNGTKSVEPTQRVYATALAMPIYDRPKYVEQAKKMLPEFMERLGVAAGKFGEMVVRKATEREIAKAAQDKKTREMWEEVARAKARGDQRTALLNGGLLLAGAAALGGAWWLKKRKGRAS